MLQCLLVDMQDKSSNAPYQTLGAELRTMRERSNETLAEVSGAVEIDQEALEKIESGIERPSEDILMLLISHFNIQDHEAVRLWETAGYESYESDTPRPARAEGVDKAALILLAMDARILYSDNASVQANDSGIVVTFGQAGQQGQSIPVSKVGMSYDQATKVLEALQRALLYGKHQGKPKRLPPTS